MYDDDKKVADMSKFAALILTHGRPGLSDTYDKLRSCGYTGRVVFVIDNEDIKAQEYYDKYGSENVFMFNKSWAANHCDSMNNFGSRKAILFARNESFLIAKELGIDYFVQLDDDYYYFGHRGEHGAKKTNNLDFVFKSFIEFLLNTNENVKTIAFSQGGDHIGGWNKDVLVKRKAMNSFFCLTNRPFKFYGILNEDVNCYLINGSRGEIFLTYMAFQLDQADTQQNPEGITTIYLRYGTYVKSFYSIIGAPSCTYIKLMGCNAMRLHHSINWQNAIPMILSEKHKKN